MDNFPTCEHSIRLGQRLSQATRGLARSLILTLLVVAGTSQAATTDQLSQIRQLTQLAEYIGVDYTEAVIEGEIVNHDEYQEMVEFSQLIVERSESLSEDSDVGRKLTAEAKALRLAIQKREGTTVVRQLSAVLRGTLLGLMPQSPLPKRLLSTNFTESLFQSNCASCHGVSGKGSGPLAKQFDPPPTDFTDKQRALNRSILGLHDAIANGIDGTAMSSFQQLTGQQRWSLAFYVGGLAFSSGLSPVQDSPITLQKFVNQAPVELVAEDPEIALETVERLRVHPATLFRTSYDPLDTTRDRLREARSAHDRGDYSSASELAVSAYLDGFELIEDSVDTRDKVLRRSIEANLMELRGLMKQAQPSGRLDEAMARTLTSLDSANRVLTESTLSGAALFTASLVILLREGLEALLVVIALATVLIRTDRRDALRYVHLGWIAALLAGFATWVAAQTLVDISGASREVMEGVAALIAALVLLYVGIWMHSKTHAAEWQAYIQSHINARLKSGTLWGLAALAFVAVYREVFETVLFYQSLLTQAVSTQYSFVLGGLIVGILLLAVVAWALIVYSVKLPIARFFSTTTYLLLALAFVLMGKGVSALQEAAIIDATSLPVSFEMDWLGVKSTWQGILAQLMVLLAFLVFMSPSRSRSQN